MGVGWRWIKEKKVKCMDTPERLCRYFAKGDTFFFFQRGITSLLFETFQNWVTTLKGNNLLLEEDHSFPAGT